MGLGTRRVNGGLENSPREERAFLAIRGQPGTKVTKHVLCAELFYVLHRLPVKQFREHRGRRLTDAATFAVEIDVLDLSSIDNS